MSKPCLSVFAALATAAALTLLPGTAAAQRRGGGRVGGGPAVSGARYYGGGARYYGGGARYYGGGRYYGGWGIGVGIGVPGYYGYGYPPVYYGAGTIAYDTYPYYAPAPNYYTAPTYDYGALAPVQDNTAHIRVIVPPGAKVTFGNKATQQDGAVRQFESPPLVPGKEYDYDVTVQWREGGKDVTQTRHVAVRANSAVTVDFTQ